MKIRIPLIGQFTISFKSRNVLQLERLMEAFSKDSSMKFPNDGRSASSKPGGMVYYGPAGMPGQSIGSTGISMAGSGIFGGFAGGFANGVARRQAIDAQNAANAYNNALSQGCALGQALGSGLAGSYIQVDLTTGLPTKGPND